LPTLSGILEAPGTAGPLLATERRLIERGELNPPTQRAAEKNAQGVTLAEYGCKWIELAHHPRRTAAAAQEQGALYEAAHLL